MPPNHTIRRDLRRAWLCLLVATTVLVVRLFTFSGLFSTVRVTGGSMAEAYCGEHAQLQCSRCQFAFRVDLVPWQKRSHSVCPDCQQALDATQAVSQQLGECVLIDRAAFWFAKPQRYDVIALHEPKTNDLAMKRILALPHERWEFRRGDLFINEQLLRKTIPQCLETAVLVHDDAHRVQSTKSRWQTGGNDSNWITPDDGFSWSSTATTLAGQGRGVDWLTYYHQPSHPAAKVNETCVKDFDPYNSTLARPLQPVTDLIVRGNLHGSETSIVYFRMHDGYETHELKYSLKKYGSRKTQTFLFGLCDRTLWLQVNGEIIERKELGWHDHPPECISQPLAIGGAGEGSIEVRKIQIWRDIHYLAPNGISDTWQPERLPKNDDDGYIVLGDNQPLSIDSRHWGSIERKRIMGRVMQW